MFIVGLLASYYIARRFGDLAGTDAATKYEEEKEKRERVAALQALLNQVGLATKIAQENARQNYTGYAPLVRIPTHAFEEAFVSNKPAVRRSF
jgi:hypothetical protein